METPANNPAELRTSEMIGHRHRRVPHATVGFMKFIKGEGMENTSLQPIFSEYVERLRSDKVRGVTFSQHNPFLYSINGQYLSLYKYDDNSISQPIRRVAKPTFLHDEKNPWVQAMTTRSNELVILGSADGVVTLWDFGFDSKSGEQRHGEPKLDGAPLATFQLKTPLSKHLPVSYELIQENGKLFVAGGRSFKTWDLVSEKTVEDFVFVSPHDWYITAISSDLSRSRVFAVGRSDGYVGLYDHRYPNSLKDSHHRTNEAPIRGVKLRMNEGNGRVYSVDEDGLLLVHDLRKSSHPVDKMTLFDGDHYATQRALSLFDVHQTEEILAAAIPVPDSEVRVFDLFGNKVSPKHESSNVAMQGNYPSAMGFHPTRQLIAVGYENESVAVYELSHN